jgi:Ca2+-binding RTX toxin-like protein
LSDSSTVNLKALSIITLGTDGNDSLWAPSYNTGANDIADGREGNDTLGGGAGNDAYIFSVGNDIINETSADDTIRVRDSYDPSELTIAFVEFSFADNPLQLTGSRGNTILITNEVGVEPCAKTRRVF